MARKQKLTVAGALLGILALAACADVTGIQEVPEDFVAEWQLTDHQPDAPDAYKPARKLER